VPAISGGAGREPKAERRLTACPRAGRRRRHSCAARARSCSPA
jgi:hypothetical protein